MSDMYWEPAAKTAVERLREMEAEEAMVRLHRLMSEIDWSRYNRTNHDPGDEDVKR